MTQQKVSKKEVLISADNISKDFKIGKRIVSGIRQASFDVIDGSFVVIHGPSGSGKSTLLNIITGLEKPTTGAVTYQGKDIYGLNEQELAHFRASLMGIVHQSSYWVKSLNVLENVALPLFFMGYTKDNAEREARESLKRVGMDSYAGNNPALLSGGEQQRVSLARALVANPNYIVADEPTGNLDSQNGDAVLDLLDFFHKKLERTIILVTHNKDYLKYGTQILQIKDGVIAESAGKGSIIKQKPSSFQPIFEKLRPISMRMIIKMAFANLRLKRFRNNLTMFGVAIGVSVIFLLLSFSFGLQHLVQKDIIGTDSVRVINVTSTNSEILKLNLQSVDRLKSIAGTEKIGKQNTVATEFKLDSANGDGVIYGVDSEYLALISQNMVAGSKIQASEVDQLMISESLVKTLGYNDMKQVVGKKINLTLKLDDGEKQLTRPLKIVGIFESKSGSSMYISQEIFKGLGVDEFKQLKIVANNSNDVGNIRKQIEAMGYQTTSPLDTVEQVDRFFGFFNIILIGFGSIGILIATTGMLNTLTIALLERIKEVGLMITLGARHRDMRRLFMAESIILTTIGGLAGIVIALVGSFIINLVLNNVAVSRGVNEGFKIFTTPWWLFLGSFLFMLVIGYVVSLVPAIRAGKIAPIDALRRE